MKALMPLFLACLLLSAGSLVLPVRGQTSSQSFEKEPVLPKVFQLGNHDKQYENIVPGYQTLLEACGGDMDLAFKKLFSMMKEMEAYADIVGFDLKGVNAWMHFFWKQDGTIDHIGFHLKPNSRNIDTHELETFLNGFTAQYTFPLSSDMQYAHYSSFSFPVF